VMFNLVWDTEYINYPNLQTTKMDKANRKETNV